MRPPLGLPARRVATQREYVLDPGVAYLVDTHGARLRARPRLPCIWRLNDVEPDRHALLPADRVLNVHRVVLPVGAGDREEDREPAPEAEPALLGQRAAERERPPAQL